MSSGSKLQLDGRHHRSVVARSGECWRWCPNMGSRNRGGSRNSPRGRRSLWWTKARRGRKIFFTSRLLYVSFTSFLVNWNGFSFSDFLGWQFSSLQMERHDNVFTKKCISVYFNDTIPRHKIVITCNEITPSPPNKCLIYLPLPGTGGIHFEYSEVHVLQ